MQSKWDKAFWARGYYVETIGNILDAAVACRRSKEGKFKRYRFIADQ